MSSTGETMVIDSVFDISDGTSPHDAILVVEDKKFYVQTERLSESSEFFKSLFEQPMEELNETTETVKEEITPKKKKSFKLFGGCFKAPAEEKMDEEEEEAKSKEYEIKDVSADEFSDFLKLFYPGEFQVNVANYLYLADLSVRFATTKGLNLCKSFVQYNFEEISVVKMIEFAVKFDVEDMKDLCSQLITSDLPDERLYPWLEDYSGDSSNASIKVGLDHAYSFPFTKGSFFSNNKEEILAASDKVKAFILHEIVNDKF